MNNKDRKDNMCKIRGRYYDLCVPCDALNVYVCMCVYVCARVCLCECTCMALHCMHVHRDKKMDVKLNLVSFINNKIKVITLI